MRWIICHFKRQLFTHKMTPILFWNIKWFIRFTFLSHDHGNARYTMAKRTHVLWMHKLMLRNRAWHQMNQIFKTTVHCVHHSFELLPSVCHAWTCWLMICWSRLSQQPTAGAHSVLEIVQVGNWNAIHALLEFSPDSRLIVDRIYVLAVGWS